MIGGSRSKGASSAAGPQSWRELAGPRRLRVNSRKARKRRQLRWIKYLTGLLLLSGVVAGVYWTVSVLGKREEIVPLAASSKPIKRILFDTDGVLPDNWLSQRINLRPGVSIMEADIYALKKALEADDQVLSASVERVFPSDLRIYVIERQPALRLALADADGRRRVRLVGRDGQLYDGIGYSNTKLEALPFVQPYQPVDGSVFPLRGVEQVADLLELVRRRQPQLFKTWKVVSLQHYCGDPNLPGQVIEERSTVVPTIIFGAFADYSQQLDRLMYIFKYLSHQGNSRLQRIDLSLRGSAAVQFKGDRLIRF